MRRRLELMLTTPCENLPKPPPVIDRNMRRGLRIFIFYFLVQRAERPAGSDGNFPDRYVDFQFRIVPLLATPISHRSLHPRRAAAEGGTPEQSLKCYALMKREMFFR